MSSFVFLQFSRLIRFRKNLENLFGFFSFWLKSKVFWLEYFDAIRHYLLITRNKIAHILH